MEENGREWKKKNEKLLTFVVSSSSVCVLLRRSVFWFSMKSETVSPRETREWRTSAPFCFCVSSRRQERVRKEKGAHPSSPSSSPSSPLPSPLSERRLPLCSGKRLFFFFFFFFYCSSFLKKISREKSDSLWHRS